MSKKVLIIGAGPRGIAVAIEAKSRGYDCVFIDKHPMTSWNDTAPGMMMRSPLCFDLVYPRSNTWDDYSLMKYVDPDVTESHWGECQQRGMEYQEDRCSRDTFISYATHCLYKTQYPIIRDRVLMVGKTWVRTSNEYITGDVVVVATGLSPITYIPQWVEPVSDKLVTAREVIDGVPLGTYAVIGSGQSAAEYALLLSTQGHKVYWLVNDRPRVSQYPAPSYIDWGLKSALSGYYRTIPNDMMKKEYMMQIGAWQPSITPMVSTLIHQQGDSISILEGPGTREGYQTWETLQRKIDGALLCTGNKPSIIDYGEEPHRVAGKLVLNSFMASNGVYHTGLVAVGYDGPRQASLISAGITAKEILEHANLDSQP